MSACQSRGYGAFMQDDGERFVPRGAIAFFISLVIFYIGFWSLIMAIMIGRR